MSIKRRVFEIVEVAAPGDKASSIFDVTIISLIILNIIAFVLESVESVRLIAPDLFNYFEYVSVGVFSIEYVARLWSCTEAEGYERPIRGRIRFMFKPLVLVDLLAILPAYLPLLGVDLRVFRALRLFRLARLAKLARYTRALQVIQRVLMDKKEELVTTIAFLLVLVLFASSLMYFAERHTHSTAFSSIPSSMWWAVTTLTTVGYGDMYPTTALGKLLGAIIAILGIGMFALPTGILGAAFADEIGRKHNGKTCPHCGGSL